MTNDDTDPTDDEQATSKHSLIAPDKIVGPATSPADEVCDGCGRVDDGLFDRTVDGREVELCQACDPHSMVNLTATVEGVQQTLQEKANRAAETAASMDDKGNTRFLEGQRAAYEEAAREIERVTGRSVT